MSCFYEEPEKEDIGEEKKKKCVGKFREEKRKRMIAKISKPAFNEKARADDGQKSSRP